VPWRFRSLAIAAASLAAACAAPPPPADPVAAIERLRLPEDGFIVYGDGSVAGASADAQITHVIEASRCGGGVSIRERRLVRDAPDPLVAFFGRCL
jgi:hypothetical protein